MRTGESQRDAAFLANVALAYDHTVDIIFLLSIDGEIFRFDSVNRAFLATTGLSHEQVAGRRVEDVLPESSHALVLGKYREAMHTHAPVDWEEVAVFPAGKRVGHVRVVPVFDERGVCTHLVGT